MRLPISHLGRCALSLSLCYSLASAEPPTPQLPAFPKPQPAQAFPELKVYDTNGSPIRAAQEDWDGARQRVDDDPRWKDFVQTEKERVDAWMARHHDRVAWIGGWSNNFVSPRDGSRLTWTEEIPGEDTDHFFSASDPRVEITPELHAAWVRLFRERHADTMQAAARLYRLTGEERYARWAKEQMGFYSDNLLKWAPQRQGARLYWQSLTEAVNLITYADTVRLLGDYVSADTRQRWKRDFFDPEVAVADDNFNMVLNITCWLRSASAQVGLVFGDEAMWRKAIYGEWGVRQQIQEGITSEYLWYEQSMGYNSYVVSALNSLFVTAGLYGRADELADEMAVVENLMLSTTYLRFPDSSLPNPSDTKGILTAPDPEQFADLYRVFPTTLGLATAKNRYGWNTLIDPAEAPGRAVELPEPKSWNLSSSYMAVLKDENWQAFIHYGQGPIKSHLQAEALNYSLFYRETEITHDPGTVGYGSDWHKDYFTRGLNHNVPLMGGEGQEQPPKGRKPDPFAYTRRGEVLDFDTTSISVAQPVYRSDVSATRSLELSPDAFIDTVTIRANDGSVRSLGLALHIQGHAVLPASFQPDDEFASAKPDSFGYWEEAVSASFEDRASFVIDFSGQPMRLTFDCPQPFRVWHATTPDVPPAKRQGFYLETSAAETTFTTTLEPIE